MKTNTPFLRIIAITITLLASLNTWSQCNIVVSYTVIPAFNGGQTFSNTSTGVNANTTYFWNFGDGATSTQVSPLHVYKSNGTYYSWMKATNSASPTCHDSIMKMVTVTNTMCTAFATFTLLPHSSIPHFYYAIPDYYANLAFSGCGWNWGDNSSDPYVFVSHTYSAAGNYNICFTASASCGATASACSNYTITRSTGAAAIATVYVVPPGTPTGLLMNSVGDAAFSIYPNPNNGSFKLDFSNGSGAVSAITVYNQLGQAVLSPGNPRRDEEVRINLGEVPEGIYFITVKAGERIYTKKFVVTR